MSQECQSKKKCHKSARVLLLYYELICSLQLLGLASAKVDAEIYKLMFTHIAYHIIFLVSRVQLE